MARRLLHIPDMQTKTVKPTLLAIALTLVACNAAVDGDVDLEERSTLATGGGLWDQGFQQAIARGDLGNISKVTIGTCFYPGAPGNVFGGCPTGPSTYTQSNFFSTVYPVPTASYWVIDHNNEPAFDNCNSGPPNQSLAVGSGLSNAKVFNLLVGQGSSGRRASFRLRNQYNPCPGGTSYLAIGANKHRGNAGKDVGGFVRSHSGTTGFATDFSTVSFRAALTQCSSAPCLFYFNIHARYNGKPRLLVLTIGHINHAGEHLKHAHWNWPVTQSYFYNGYDIVYLRCNESGVPCLPVSSTPTTYKFAMSRILATASPLFDDPIAVGTQVSIEGVSWALETTGSAADTTAWVEGMRVDATTSPSPSPAPVVSFSSSYDGSSTSVTLSSSQTLYGKVTNLSATNAQACLEVVGRPIIQQNGDGWCNDLGHWTSMTSSSSAGSWSHAGGVWRLTVSPVSSLFPPGSYRSFWRNISTGQKAVGLFTVQSSSAGTRSPIGWLDSVAGGVAAGWACDPDKPTTSINVHLYIGGPAGSGATVYSVPASKANEAAVTTACGGGAAHRFTFAIPNWAGFAGKPVHAYGIDVTSNPNLQLSGSPKTLPSSGGSSGKSCSGRCGTHSVDGTCWCDSLCSSYGDCCADKIQYCP